MNEKHISENPEKYMTLTVYLCYIESGYKISKVKEMYFS
ncbi:hypothetical protein SAMN05216390_1348 [Lachnospiraceae bacterium KH1T2]|nr:hypothetical protein SAMN05216390_1348 [Lachnospiraceae bacterium KH1T2]